MSDPEDIRAWQRLSERVTTSGRLQQAESVLRDALGKHADSVVAMNNLAQTLSDQGRNGEALALIEKAAKAGGPFAQAVEDTHQSILKRMGKR